MDEFLFGCKREEDNEAGSNKDKEASSSRQKVHK
jgi:hypothetical protein